MTVIGLGMMRCRVFPVWLKGKDASFTNLRARGAFLVSGEYRRGAVTHIDITSETGGDCAVANPWGDMPCDVVRTTPSGPEKVELRPAAAPQGEPQARRGGRAALTPPAFPWIVPSPVAPAVSPAYKWHT